MANYDLPMESSPPPEESAYPDIDETLHYPWQASQQLLGDEVPTSAIDPRLFPQNDAVYPQQYSDEDEDEVANDAQSYPPPRALVRVDPGDVDDSDSDYSTETESER